LGKDVSLKDLRDQYDVVVLATGASKGRKLGIPGEN
jgi:ferredoxin--NADP+ reductase